MDMGIVIVDIEKPVETKFRAIVAKKFGPGEQAVELVINELMKRWVESKGGL